MSQGLRMTWMFLVVGVIVLASAAAIRVQGEHSRVPAAPIPSKEVLVAAGQFAMGCMDDHAVRLGIKCDTDARPIHTVYLDSYFIDQTEVTNAQYAACVAAGACLPPIGNNSETRADYFINPIYANYPVVQMDWERADNYCRWAGKRLPSEAEWEKAARGDDLRAFAWGNTYTCDHGNIRIVDSYCVGDTTPVGSYPTGASPYGALDMTGNAMEWVNDRYERFFYHWSPYYNPQGASPESSSRHLIRGGSYTDDQDASVIWNRMDDGTDYTMKNGFRCARSAPGVVPTPTPAPTPTPPAPAIRSFGPEGGLLWQAYESHVTMLIISAGAITTSTTLTIYYDQRPDRQQELQGFNHFFTVGADPSLPISLNVALGYPDHLPIISGTMGLYRLEAMNWVTEGITLTSMMPGATLAQIDRIGIYGLLGQTNLAYLPIVLRE